MAEPFIGQIMQVGFSFAPRGWALCAGQLMSIPQNAALFSLLGTTFGGNGQTTFGLPDARGRAFVGTGQGPGLSNYVAGEMIGVEQVTLLTTNMPTHTHTATFTGQLQALAFGRGATSTISNTPTANAHLANSVDQSTIGSLPSIYAPSTTTGGSPINLAGVSGTVTNQIAGGSQPFSILNPLLAVTTIIAQQGIFPSRN